MVHPTSSFERPTAEDRFRVLPSDIVVSQLVRRARIAGLAFMTGAAFGLRRVDLRSWILEHYEGAVAYSRVGAHAIPRDESADLDEMAFAELVRHTRERVMRMLVEAHRNWSVPTFARAMIDHRLVVAIYDRSGDVAYAPAAHADLRLVDRVASLFIADFLSDPSDYALVTPCEQCGEVGLGGKVDHASWCTDAPTRSGIIARTRGARDTVPGMGAVSGE
jgi:hypothetical protein